MNPHTCIIKSSVSLFQIYSPLFTSHLFTSAQVAKKKKILHSYSTIFLHTTYIFNADLHCQSRKTCRVLHSGKLTAKYFCNCLLLLVTKWQKNAENCTDGSVNRSHHPFPMDIRRRRPRTQPWSWSCVPSCESCSGMF